MDRGYLDFERLHRFTDEAAFLVTRSKKGIAYRRRVPHPVDFATGLVSDHTVVLATAKARHDYPDQLRRVRYVDPETTKRLTFLTNNFTLPALSIPQLYKSRWYVELFFQWIKQHLRIKAFYGTSENAVKTQIWIAVSVYVLVVTSLVVLMSVPMKSPAFMRNSGTNVGHFSGWTGLIENEAACIGS